MNIDYDSPAQRYSASPITPEDARRVALAACGVAMLFLLAFLIGAAWVYAHSDPQHSASPDTAVAEGRN